MLPRRKIIITFCLGLALLISACRAASPAADPTQSPTPTATSPSQPIPPSPTPIAQTTAPTPTENAAIFFPDLEAELIPGVDWHILIEDAQTGEILFERSATAGFHPASMIKIPTAMAVLSILEDQGRGLKDLKSSGIEGRSFDSLLEAMVVHSEESAADSLEYFARGENRLRKKLDGWGLSQTKFDPRVSTAAELLTSLELLHTGQALNPENTHYLLELMGVYTENDRILLGKLTETLPECTFLNKRGTMLSPTIVSDMGILKCGDHVWYLVIAGTPSIDSTATFEDIQASIEAFAAAFADFVK